MINKLFNTNQNLTNFSKPTQEAKTMSNIETLQNEFNIARENFTKATEKFERKKAAPETTLRSIADLKRDKLAMIDAEILLHEAELELLAEKEEVEQRENSVGTAQIELDLTIEKIKSALDAVGINTRSCYRTSDTQAEIMLLNTHVKTSLLYKAAIEKLKQAGAMEHTIEQNARRVASALNAAQGKREDFFRNERRGI